MYIIIIGGGGVGYFLSRTLISEGHEVLVVEKDAPRCEIIKEELGSIAVRGDGSEVATLEDAGTRRADVFIAVAGNDEDNLAACQLAKHKFGVPRTVARVKNPENEVIFKKLGVDATVSSTNLILTSVEQEISLHLVISILKSGQSELEMVKVKIPSTSPAIGKWLGSLPLPEGVLIPLISGNTKDLQIPKGSTILEAEDEVVAVVKPENREKLYAILVG